MNVEALYRRLDELERHLVFLIDGMSDEQIERASRLAAERARKERAAKRARESKPLRRGRRR